MNKTPNLMTCFGCAQGLVNLTTFSHQTCTHPSENSRIKMLIIVKDYQYYIIVNIENYFISTIILIEKKL